MNTPSPLKRPKTMEERYIDATREVDSIITCFREALCDRSLGLNSADKVKGSIILSELEVVHKTLTGHRKLIREAIQNRRESATTAAV